MRTTKDNREVIGVAQGVRAGDKAVSIPIRTAMQAKREQLEKSAMESAVSRGHRMTPFATLYEQRHIAESICEKCEAYVQVNAKPAPNGIDIGGTAVALNCNVND